MGNGAGGGSTLAGVICTEAAGTEASGDGSATWTTGAPCTAGRVLGVVLATVVVLVAFVWGASVAGVAAGGGAACGGAATGGVPCEGVVPEPGDGGVAGAAAALATWRGSWLAAGPSAGEAAPTNIATIAATPQLAAVE